MKEINSNYIINQVCFRNNSVIKDLIFAIHSKQPTERVISEINALEKKLEKNLFPALLQSLFYYIFHGSEDEKYSEELSEEIIDSFWKNIFYQGDECQIWVDPKTRFTCFYQLVNKGCFYLAEKLLECLCNGQSLRNLESARFLLTHQTELGYTPIISSVRSGFLDTTKMLIEISIDIFWSDPLSFLSFIMVPFNEKGQTGLHICVFLENTDMLKLILKVLDEKCSSELLNIILNAQDLNGFTPINTVCNRLRSLTEQSLITENQEVLFFSQYEILKSYGADEYIKNDYGFSAAANLNQYWDIKENGYSKESQYILQ